MYDINETKHHSCELSDYGLVFNSHYWIYKLIMTHHYLPTCTPAIATAPPCTTHGSRDNVWCCIGYEVMTPWSVEHCLMHLLRITVCSTWIMHYGIKWPLPMVCPTHTMIFMNWWAGTTFTHQKKMVAILQMIFSDAFLWTKSFVCWLKFHWSLFLRVQSIITRCWFR